MALQIKQVVRQIQQLVMTPQLQQAIKLLQYSHQEMISALEEELKENPMLEATAFDDPFTEQESGERNDLKALEDLTGEPTRPENEISDADWENYMDSYGADYGPSQIDWSERRPLEAMVTYQKTLFHHLLEQLQLSAIEGDDRRIALEIIGNVGDTGYLEAALDEVAEPLEVPVKEVERLLKEVQKFDPPGVAARDIRECLLIQARQLDPENPVAVRVLDEAFDLFQRGKLDQVARKMKVSPEAVKDAAQVISRLEPRPGRIFAMSDTVFAIPDIYVIKDGEEYAVVLNDDGLPRLRVSPAYQGELHGGVPSSSAKDYIHEKTRAAAWLIKSIHQRQRTIYKVTESIVKFQRDFLDKGIDYLKPLILKDVADDIGMHESTISRVTTNKYVHTPRGIFELKYFFNSGIRHGNEEIASESVKNQILRIVKSESTEKPASDQQIVEELARTQIHIARRTVAKYRELLGIPPSSQRRKKF
jgi:RNA polymerase sigma-54 factor